MNTDDRRNPTPRLPATPVMPKRPSASRPRRSKPRSKTSTSTTAACRRSNLQPDLAENHVTALIGPSGCGKTTSALLQPHARPLPQYPLRRRDPIHPDNINILGSKIDPIEMRMRITMVFRKPNPFPKSIYENVAYGLRVRGASAEHGRRQGRTGAARRGPVGRSEGSPASPGVQPLRRPATAAVHRARPRHRPGNPAVRRTHLGPRPDRHGQDRRTRAELKERVTIIIVTHNMQQAARVSDYTAFMYLGELVEWAEPTHVHQSYQQATEDYITGRYG